MGTLLYFSNYKERVREGVCIRWDRYKFVDKGRFHFPVWCYLLAASVSLVPCLNIISTIACVIVYIIQALPSDWKDSYDGHGLVETKLYLPCPLIDKIIEFLNRRV